MKRFQSSLSVVFLLLSFFLSPSPAGAQVARWMILPVHQSVEKPADTDVFICHDGDTTSLYSLDGQLLGTTTDVLNDFQEDKAVTVRRGTQTITGFFHADGHYVSVKPCQVYRDYPFFSAGYLIVQQGKGYFYIDGNGKFWKQGDVNLPARVKAPPIPTYVTKFHLTPSPDGKIGLMYNEKELVRPMFDEVKRTMTELAMVRIGNRWGVMGVDSTATFAPVLNGGDTICFRHQSVLSTVSIAVPDYMDASKVRLVVPEDSKMQLDEQSRTVNDHTITYTCELALPITMLSDGAELSYPVSMDYNGLTFPLLPFTGWGYYEGGRFSVDDLSDGAFEGNGYAFTINVKEHNRQPGDEAYPYEVEIMTSDLPYTLKKISPSKYRCKLNSLAKDNNNVYVVVREDGCPPAVFPFEITVKRPAQSSSGKGQGQVTIRKKPVTPQTPKPVIKPTEPKKPIKLL